MEHGWWIFGWATGAVVVLLVAALVLAAIVLVRRIISQAGDIIAALDGARVNTEPFYDLAHVNHALVRIAGALAPGSEGDREREQVQ